MKSKLKHTRIFCKNFKFIPLIKRKLQSFFKYIKLDVCGRPLIANPVTIYHVDSNLPVNATTC